MSAMLEARDLTKRFGGLTAVDHASLAVEQGSITALIGPNGAGKTTFFKMLAGEIAPTSGEIDFKGERINGYGVARVSRLGIGKSHQITQIFPNLTVAENVVIPALAALRGGFRADIFGSVRRVGGLDELVERTLAQVGLLDRTGVRAGELAYGEKRCLEIGLALATEPQLLLLDEPAAGMSPTETAETVDLIQRLRATVTIVIVEHDMDVVFGLADNIMVMQNGATIAYGTPDVIRADARVRDAYLGGADDE
ncbi:MAG TPA: ABC transporter ATP-binding protein [Candidatus Lustribacter sp.]|jgi:branched-chain amino acid transport system permease protein|nr:ABC transporter ATP-binding protein [Candidatus Lustribacter sp.]